MIEYLSKDCRDFFKREDRFENVFILGAGFSKPLGMPLTFELLPQCLDFCESPVYASFKETHTWMRDYSARLAKGITVLYGCEKSITAVSNIEILLTDIESYIRTAQLTGHVAHVTELDTLYKNTARLLSVYLNQKAREFTWGAPAPSKYKAELQTFLAKAWPKSTFISLNYDLILEMHGIGEAYDATYDHLIKLHGSTDLWLVSRPFSFMGETSREFTNKDIPDIESLGPERKLKRIEFHSQRASHTDLQSEDGFPLIIPPVQEKDFTRCAPYFAFLSRKAVHSLRAAKRVVAIGCAFNPIDRHFLNLIRLGHQTQFHVENPTPWHIFDPSPVPVSNLHASTGIRATHHQGSWVETFADLMSIAECSK